MAKAVAIADDVPELVTALKKRSQLIAQLEAQLIAAKRTPEDLAALVTGSSHRLEPDSTI